MFLSEAEWSIHGDLADYSCNLYAYSCLLFSSNKVAVFLIFFTDSINGRHIDQVNIMGHSFVSRSEHID